MKKLNLILSIFMAALLSACGNGNQNNSKSSNTPPNADSTKIVNEQSTDANPSDIKISDIDTSISYMTFVSNKGMDGEICIEVKYPKGDKVWIDWNLNKKCDEGEKLDTVEWCNYPGRSTDEMYMIEANMSLENSKFVIYGNVTYLRCPESGITKIDVSHNPYLEELLCHYNDIKSLDISKNKNLKILYCDNTPLTEIDISNNSKLNDLLLPYSIKSKVFEFTPEIREVSKHLQQRNLIPEGYHVVEVAYNINEENEEDVEEKNDKLVLFEEDIPYAERNNNVNANTKAIYFKSIGNNKYEIVGESDDFGFGFVKFKNENYILKNVGDVEPVFDFYKVENGKIVKTKAFALNSVEPNAEGVYEVKNTDELLGTIGSNRTIKIMAKSIELIDISFEYDLVKNIGYNDCLSHIYGIVLSDTKNLTIIGGLDEKTELILDERYAMVLSNSENIKLQNLQIKHSFKEQESSEILAFVNCKKIILDNILLSKCGKQGIRICDVEELNCKNTIIEQCTVNALELNKCKNSVFENFEISNNTLSGYFVVTNLSPETKEKISEPLIKFIDSQDIIFKTGKILNNDCGEGFVIATEKENKAITFESVEIKDNKAKATCNTTDENVVKFVE